MNIIKQVLSHTLTALYQSLGFSIVLSIFVMFFFLYSSVPLESGHGWKKSAQVWFEQFKKSITFRKMFFLTLYISLVLFKTLFNRNLWLNPLSNVMGGWWLWEADSATGELIFTTESIENILIMIPFAVLLMSIKREYVKSTSFFYILKYSTKTAFLFSACIESVQLLFRLGTFQLSDFIYNTFGGICGGVIYWSGMKLYNRISNNRKGELQ